MSTAPQATLQGFQSAFELSPNPMLLIAVDPPRFTMLAANRAHANAFRTTPEALVGHGVFDVFRASTDPQARAISEAIRHSFDRMLATRQPDEMPMQVSNLIRKDGRRQERCWCAVHTPLLDATGAVRYILSTVRDVTAEVKEKQATEARTLLMREVDHRARNALAVVQAIIRLSEGGDLATFKRVVLGRVEALARAQGSLARRKWEGALLEDVITAELDALAFPGAVKVSGPATLLPPDKVQTMGMVLHELATNAAKYGALSRPSGVVTVSWEIEAPGRFQLSWRESGGPTVSAPHRRGFGSRLVARLAQQLGGDVHKTWNPDGLHVELTVRL